MRHHGGRAGAKPEASQYCRHLVEAQEHVTDLGRWRPNPTEARVRVDALARHEVLEDVVEVGGLHVHADREDHAE